MFRCELSWPQRSGKEVNQLSHEDMKKVQEEIIKLLQQKNCTVRESKHILSQVARYTETFSPVQFRGMPDYDI